MAHDDVVTERVVVHTQPVSHEYVLAHRIIYYILDLIEIFLATRFLLKVFGANPATGFVQFMYGVTAPLVAPFQGIFPPVTDQGMVIEWATLVAMIVYAFVAYLIIRLMRGLAE